MFFALLQFSNIFCSCLLLSAAGSMIFVDPALAKEFMDNLFLKPLHLIMGENWFTAGCRYQICYFGLCYAQCNTAEDGIGDHNSLFANLSKDNHGAAAVKDIESENF